MITAPPPQWYGGVRGRLSGPPPHHRGEGSIYSVHCIYNIHDIHNIHNKHLLLHYIHYIHHHKPPPPHHRGEGSIYNIYIYIYICCIYSIYHIHNIYIKHNINILYIYITGGYKPGGYGYNCNQLPNVTSFSS